MNRVRVFTAVLIVFVLASVGFSQLSLRKAMDTDGDNKADLTIWRPSDATWYIRRAATIIVQPFGIADEDYPTPGDFDNDGVGDIAVWRDTNGTWYWINSSNSTINTQQWGLPNDEPVARDYNGDGSTDLAVVRRSNGIMTWYIFLTNIGFYSVDFGFSTDFVAPGDFDGDGSFDIAVQREGATPGSPTTFYFQNSLGYHFAEFGLKNDLFVAGDYDRDGKTDMAVVREGATADAVLTWFIKRSSDGGVEQYNWGLTGSDYTVPNDYDGDGQTDLAVWRNSDGKFYIVYSQSGAIDVISWGLPNDYPVASYDTH